MREIKFRAKDFNGSWQYGTYYYGVMYPTSHKMHYVNDEQIDENTLGQFTGLHDRNGKEIYEGDVVKCGVGQDAEIAIVEFKMQAFVITYLPLEKKDTENVHDYMEDYKHFAVLGNIYEHPHLIEKEPV